MKGNNVLETIDIFSFLIVNHIFMCTRFIARHASVHCLKKKHNIFANLKCNCSA